MAQRAIGRIRTTHNAMKCANCGTEFDPADRVSAGAIEAAVIQVKYCSETCARAAENKRYYQTHKKQIIGRILRNQRTRRIMSKQTVKRTTIEIQVDKGETYRKQFSNPDNAQKWVIATCERVWSERGNMWPVKVLVAGKPCDRGNVAARMLA